MQNDSNKKTILVADDDEEILSFISEFLNNDGYNAVTVVNGLQAVEKVKERAFDLVMLDIDMPIMNGIKALQEIKKLRPEQRVIMITAYHDAEDVVEALKIGALDCIFKPFDLKFLRNSIQAQLVK